MERINRTAKRSPPLRTLKQRPMSRTPRQPARTPLSAQSFDMDVQTTTLREHASCS